MARTWTLPRGTTTEVVLHFIATKVRRPCTWKRLNDTSIIVRAR